MFGPAVTWRQKRFRFHFVAVKPRKKRFRTLQTVAERVKNGTFSGQRRAIGYVPRPIKRICRKRDLLNVYNQSRRLKGTDRLRE